MALEVPKKKISDKLNSNVEARNHEQDDVQTLLGTAYYTRQSGGSAEAS